MKKKKVAKLAASVAKAAQQLPERDPRRQGALATALFLTMKVRNGGTVTKAEWGQLESQGQAIAEAVGDTVRAVTAPGTRPKSSEIRALLDGPPLRHSDIGAEQSPEALARYGSPAASLGQMLKSAEDQVAAAEAQLRKAEASGRAGEVERAAYDLTLAKLRKAHLIGAA